MINHKDVDAAWEKFQKTSVKGMLDTMAAQLNEISTNTERTAQMVPKVMGDEGAMNAQDPMAAMMGGAPPGPGGMPPDMGGEMPPGSEEGTDPSMEGVMPGGGDGMPMGGGPAPDELGAGMPPSDGNIGGDDIEKLLSGYGNEGDDLMADEEKEPMSEDEGPMPDEIGADLPEGGAEEPMEDVPAEGESSGEDALLGEDVPAEDAGDMVGAGPEAEMEDAAAEEGDAAILGDEAAGDMAAGDLGGAESDELGAAMDEGAAMDDTIDAEESMGAEAEGFEDLGTSDVGSAKEMTGAPTADLDNSEVNAAYSNLIEKLKASVVSAIDAKDFGSVPGITDTISALDNAWGMSVQPSLNNIAKAVAAKKKREEAIAKSVADTNAIASDSDPITATAGGAPIDKNEELMSDEDSSPVEASADVPSADADAEASPCKKSERNIESFRDMFAKSKETRDIEVPEYEPDSFQKSHEFTSMRDMMSISKSLPMPSTEDYLNAEEPDEDADNYKFKADKTSRQKRIENEAEITNIKHSIGAKPGDSVVKIKNKDGTYTLAPSSRVNSVEKSASKHIATLDEKKNLQKSNASPDRASTTNADLSRPSLESIGKSVRDTSPVIKMGVGVDPHKVVESDWAEYKAFMKSRGI